MFAALSARAASGRAEHAIRKQAVRLVLDPLPDPAFEQRK
jgi:hypothetical protein